MIEPSIGKMHRFCLMGVGLKTGNATGGEDFSC